MTWEISLAVIEFDVRQGPSIITCFPKESSLSSMFDCKIAFLALPDRSDANDTGCNYFIAKQAPCAVAGVAVYRQMQAQSDGLHRNKIQRALCLLSTVASFDFLKGHLESAASKVLWDGEHKSDIPYCERELEILYRGLIPELTVENSRRVVGPGNLVECLRVLGGSRLVLGILKCILLGNTGILIVGPSADIVSQIVVFVASLVPKFGYFLGDHESSMCYSSLCRRFIQASLRSDGQLDKSKLLFMPYCGLLELDTIKKVYEPRKAGSLMSGRFGYFAGATNPVITAHVRRNLGDLIVSLPEPTTRDSEEKPVEKSLEESSSSDGFKAQWSKAAKFMKEKSDETARLIKTKTEEVVNKLQGVGAVNVTPLSLAGKLSVDLTKEDKSFANRIDALMRPPKEDTSLSSSHALSPTKKSFSKIMGSILSSISDKKNDWEEFEDDSASSTFGSLVPNIVDPIDDSSVAALVDVDMLDQRIRGVFAEWLNSLFTTIDTQLMDTTKSKYSALWAMNTEAVRERIVWHQVVEWLDGCSYKGEMTQQSPEGFVTLPVSNEQGLSLYRHGWGTYQDGPWRYEGMWKDDMIHGQGTLSNDAQGWFYDGSWIASKRSGIGSLVIKGVLQYEGTFEADLPKGQGLVFDSEGTTYRGSWVDGKPDGEGCWVSSTGNSYHGSFNKGDASGTGYIQCADGSKYVGSWKDGQYNGRGVWSVDSNHYFEGDWDQGKKHGAGSFVFLGGTRELQGVWVWDNPDPNCQFLLKNHGGEKTVLFRGTFDELNVSLTWGTLSNTVRFDIPFERWQHKMRINRTVDGVLQD